MKDEAHDFEARQPMSSLTAAARRPSERLSNSARSFMTGPGMSRSPASHFLTVRPVEAPTMRAKPSALRPRACRRDFNSAGVILLKAVQNFSDLRAGGLVFFEWRARQKRTDSAGNVALTHDVKNISVAIGRLTQPRRFKSLIDLRAGQFGQFCHDLSSFLRSNGLQPVNRGGSGVTVQSVALSHREGQSDFFNRRISALGGEGGNKADLFFCGWGHLLSPFLAATIGPLTRLRIGPSGLNVKGYFEAK